MPTARELTRRREQSARALAHNRRGVVEAVPTQPAVPAQRQVFVSDAQRWWWGQIGSTSSAATVTPVTNGWPGGTLGEWIIHNGVLTTNSTAAVTWTSGNYTQPLYQWYHPDVQPYQGRLTVQDLNTFAPPIPDYIERTADLTARCAARAREHERANSRAEILLREHLTPAQVEELAARNHFHLETVAPNGERKRYRIRRGRHANIDQVSDAGVIIKSLCVHPNVPCPDADTMLAQKLWLETNEPELLRVANHIPGVGR